MTEPQDFSKLPNPYDFANPITEPTLFSGRTNEIQEIHYYLDHAKSASRPINIALLGPRASGKTSLLNMIEYESVKREFCVARVDLDEGDVSGQLSFFYKIFDSILFSACLTNAYGGLSGKTYDTYRNMVDAFETPDDKLFCPFFFPPQYSKAMSKGNTTAFLSDVAFRQDMANIRKEVNKPIIVLFDEGDVLIKSRVNLEKLRNIFMATPGYMVVLAGTPALFPLMDEVFSPIVRQFKKINIGAFLDKEETRDCVLKPLMKIGIPNPGDLFENETFDDIEEIHSLSGGRPYEIQLICHFLFRRLQDKRTTRMELTLDVLDDVRRELETSQDVSVRPILTAIKNYNKQRLGILAFLCSCNDRASFDQLWFAEYILRGTDRWTRETLEKELKRMESEGIITTTSGNIRFLGDEFDKVYCRYYAKKHDVLLDITSMPYEAFLSIRTDNFVRARFRSARHYTLLNTEPQDRPPIEELSAKLASPISTEDPFKTNRHLAEFLYWTNMDFQGDSKAQVVMVSLQAPTTTIYRIYRNKKTLTEGVRSITELPTQFKKCSDRASELNGQASAEAIEFPIVLQKTLLEKILNFGNAKLNERLANEHHRQLFTSYSKEHNISDAIAHGECAFSFKPSSEVANNLGYLYGLIGRLDDAVSKLTWAMEHTNDPDDRALHEYNFGVIALKQNRTADALMHFSAAVHNRSKDVSCLLLPVLDPQTQELSFTEVQSPELEETAKRAIEITRHYASSHST